jgi:hypothetical protein
MIFTEHRPPLLQRVELLLRVVLVEHRHHLDCFDDFLRARELRLRGDGLEPAAQFLLQFDLPPQACDVELDDATRVEAALAEDVPDLLQ